MTWWFFALQPEQSLYDRVSRLKEQAALQCGPQLYLTDPPHTTVYLACYEAAERVHEAMSGFSESRPGPPECRITGWHVFQSDPLTGNDTLVCRLSEDCTNSLRLFQKNLVEAAAPLRSIAGTAQRYAARLEKLTQPERANIDHYGFPFVGDVWQPHITIASFVPADLVRCFPVLEDGCPTGGYTYSTLVLYRLRDGVPVVERTLALEPS